MRASRATSTMQRSTFLSRRSILLIAFALSGFAGLTYQITWGRILARTFGASAPALATVLAVFMGGLGLGALLAGQRADAWSERRALRVYVGLELAVAFFGLIAPSVLSLTGDAYTGLAGLVGFGALARGTARMVTATLALGPATVLMGASFPVLMRISAPTPARTATLAGALQGANVVGALVGAWGTGFVLLPRLGDTTTTFFAAGTNVAAAMVVLVLARRASLEPPRPPPGEGATARPSRALLAVAFSTGALILGYEVVWARLLVPLFAGTVYAASAVLGTVLLGLAIGAWIASALGDRLPRPHLWFAGLACGAALASAGGLHLVSSMVRPAVAIMRDANSAWTSLWGIPVLIAMPIVLPPAILSGIAFPVGVRAAAADRTVALASGWMLAANTFGSIIGAVAAGLIGIEAVGTWWTAVILTIGATLVALALLLTEAGQRPRAAALGALVAVSATALTAPTLDIRVFSGGLLLLPDGVQRRLINHGFYERTSTELLYRVEGAETAVFVERTRRGRVVFIGGRAVASEEPLDLRNQYLLGHLPALIHGAPERSLVVGLGAGTTAGALSLHGQLDVCELSSGVVGATRHFAELNHDVVSRPNVRVVIEDGRTYLRSRPEPYDVISVDPVHPHVAGAAGLYTADYFQLVRSRLTPGGVAAHWMPLYQLGWDDVAGVMHAWVETFPNAAVYLAGYDAVLVGSPSPEVELLPMPEWFERGFERDDVREDLARVYLETPERLAATGSLDGEELAALVAHTRPLSDDHNWLEFSAAERARASPPSPLRDLLAARHAPPPEATQLHRRAHETYTAILRSLIAAWFDGSADETRSILESARDGDPESTELRARLAITSPGPGGRATPDATEAD